MASEAFEDDNCSTFVSEDDSETQSVSSFSSGPTSPSEVPDRCPVAVRPGSLDLPSPVSLSEFGMMFPVLGPRSECSGASSPECEVERGECPSWMPGCWGRAGVGTEMVPSSVPDQDQRPSASHHNSPLDKHLLERSVSQLSQGCDRFHL